MAERDVLLLVLQHCRLQPVAGSEDLKLWLYLGHWDCSSCNMQTKLYYASGRMRESGGHGGQQSEGTSVYWGRHMSGGCLVILYEASASFSTKLSKIGCLLLTLEQTNVISNLMLFRLKRVVQAPLPTMYNSNCVKRQTQSPMQRWRSLHHIIKRKIGVVLIVFGLCCLFFGSSTNVTPLKPVSTSVYSGFLF